MSARPLPGAPVAQKLRAQTAQHVATLRERGTQARLAVVLATDNESTAWYVRSIVAAAQAAGIDCRVLDLGARAGAEELQVTLRALAEDDSVHGIILQTPLPPGIEAAALAALIPPHKDLDGANPESLGRLAAGLPAFAATTAQAAIELLEHYAVPLAGEHVTVIGRSTVVGKPLAQLLLQRDATVTMCHSRTSGLPQHTRNASVVVLAAGRAGLLRGDDIAEHCVVIDVGTSVDGEGKLVGDADASVRQAARALTPVPGGVGTVTTALLLQRVSRAALDSATAALAVN